MEFDFDAAVEVQFAEDLTYSEVAPLLDAFAETAIFNVRAGRVGWSGPAAGGPELGIVITAAAAVGASAFAKTFFEELAKDTYKGVRAAMRALVRRLRDKPAPRAVLPLVVDVGAIRICFGSMIHEDAGPGEWTDEWLLARLVEAQSILDASPDLVEAQPARRTINDPYCDHELR